MKYDKQIIILLIAFLMALVGVFVLTRGIALKNVWMITADTVIIAVVSIAVAIMTKSTFFPKKKTPETICKKSKKEKEEIEMKIHGRITNMGLFAVSIYMVVFYLLILGSAELLEIIMGLRLELFFFFAPVSFIFATLILLDFFAFSFLFAIAGILVTAALLISSLICGPIEKLLSRNLWKQLEELNHC